MVSLRQLRYLESLAETRHFGHAADACAVSQPALSMQIKELEDELKLSLVERRKSGIALTDQGEEIARRARGILASVRSLRSRLTCCRPRCRNCSGVFRPSTSNSARL
jgi:LysR family hydrogen peroxide-inducible transcriptional activator